MTNEKSYEETNHRISYYNEETIEHRHTHEVTFFRICGQVVTVPVTVASSRSQGELYGIPPRAGKSCRIPPRRSRRAGNPRPHRLALNVADPRAAGQACGSSADRISIGFSIGGFRLPTEIHLCIQFRITLSDFLFYFTVWSNCEMIVRMSGSNYTRETRDAEPEPEPEPPEPTHFGRSRSRSRSRRNGFLGAGARAGAVKKRAAPAPKRNEICGKITEC